MTSLIQRITRRGALAGALLFLLSAQAFSALTDGLIGHWTFDEGSGSSAFDSSGNFSTGAVTGAGWTSSGRIGGAIDFDGVGFDNVLIPHNAIFNTPNTLSVSLWVYNRAPTCNCGIATAYGILAKRPNSFNPGGSWIMYWEAKDQSANPGFLFRARRSDNSSDNYVYGANQAKNTWIHLVGVFDNGNVRIYKDGVLLNGPNYIGTSDLFTNSNPIEISGSVTSTPWNGRMDDLRIYNRALTPTEIQQLYELGNVPTSPGSSLSAQIGVLEVSSVTVSWSTASSTGYILEASTDSSFRGAVFSSATPASGTSSLNIGGLAPNTTYFLRVAVASDAFNASSLAPVWVSSDSAGDGTISLVNNPGHLQFARPITTAGILRVLRDVSNINGVFETKIDGVNLAGTGTQGYGLVLYQDDDDFIVFQYWQSGAGHKVLAFKSTGGTFTEPIARVAVTMGSANYLRVTKVNTTYTLEHRQDGGAWASAGAMTDGTFTLTKTGLLLNSEDIPPVTTANFDYYTGPYALTSPTATVTLAATPNAMSFGNITTDQFQARWGINGNPTGTIFDVRIATSIGFTTIVATAATVSSHTLFTSLTANTTYFVRVRAINHGGLQTGDALGAVVTSGGVITVSADKAPNVWSNALTTVFFAQGAGAARFFYRISANISDPAQTTDTEFDGSATVAAVAEGSNYIHVLGTDAGLAVVGRADFGPITIDRSSPTVFSITAQRSAANTTPILDGGSTFIATPRFFWVGTSISPIVGYSYSIAQNAITTPGTTINTTLNFTDINLGQPGVYYVKVRALSLAGTFGDPIGMSFTYGAVPDVNTISIRKNYFNPIRGECARLDIQASSAGKIKAVVYTLLGQKVATLADQDAAAGSYTFSWCGKNDANQTVATGGYLLRVEAPGQKKTLKLAVGK